MKTRGWIVIFAAVLAVCVGLSLLFLLPGQDAAFVEVRSEGKLLYTLPLNVDQQLEIVSENGTNVVTIKDGKVAVTEADCPDGYCMARGFCSGGAQIVCLPNRLVLNFTGEADVDFVVG